jgi:tetratricopeptide (TPR) repeat protein
MLVAWQGGGKREVAVPEEFSVGGVFLNLEQPLAVGTNVELLFDVPGGEVRLRGTVRHGRPGHGMGVQFVHMQGESRARLHRFVQKLQQEHRVDGVEAPRTWFAGDAQPLDSGEVANHHELFALMHKIYSRRLIGKLQLVLGRVERQLFFDGGQLVFATSSDWNDSLGEMMLRAGALTQSQFEEASELVKTGQRFGSAIAEMGVRSIEEVVVWVQRQLTQITSSVLDYPSCRYYFFESLEKNVVPEIGIPVPLGKLLLEAVRRATDLPLEQLADDAQLWIDLSPDPLLRFQAVELNANERALLGAISQPKAAKELLAQSGLARDQAARALYALMVLGIVVGVPKSAQAEKQPAAQPAAVAAPEISSAPADETERPAQQTPTTEIADKKEFAGEIRKLLELAEKSTYYDLLGVATTSNIAQIKESFHELARKFHPDKHMGQSELVDLLQDLMARLSIAYRTLIDDKKRALYDKQITAAGAFTLGKEKTETEKTVEECLAEAKQCVRALNYAGSILWLRKCVEMAPNEAKYQAILARSLAAVPQYRQDAIFHFNRAIELDEWNTSTYFQFGELYESMGLPWRAVPLYRKILEIDPAHSKAIEKLNELESKSETREKKSFVSRLFKKKI